MSLEMILIIAAVVVVIGLYLVYRNVIMAKNNV